MSPERKAVLIAGLALGALYLLEAVIATGALFFVWPILGGVFAAALLSWTGPTALSPRSGAKAGAQAAAFAGLILLAVGTPLTYFILKELGEAPGLFGRTFDLDPIPAMLLIFSIYAVFGMGVAAMAGAMTGVLRAGARSRR